ncbi:major facilitator superfamily domain-containing protein [Phascolomyces articulosus]|uniref:Major facilitator superfamily domain-containing protein n=1 Tax=Phascolomyces articulosus TaxID=60185 RepID=A0AAD5JQ12_9FUNG|nr:major facilitator superfamily domain-containing protein [Phascolomyces articulosus]
MFYNSTLQQKSKRQIFCDMTNRNTNNDLNDKYTLHKEDKPPNVENKPSIPSIQGNTITITESSNVLHVPDGEEELNETSTTRTVTRDNENNKVSQNSAVARKILPLHTNGEEFSRPTKWAIFTIVLLSQILSQSSINGFYPALPAIQKDMNTTATMTNIIVASQSLATGLMSAVWASYADGYGRRLIFIISNAFIVIGNIGSALAINIGMLIGLQLVSSVGLAATYALAVGIINDIFKDHEKGKALSWNAAMNPYSMAIAPLIGGALTDHFGWRSIFWLFVIAYSLLWISIIILLPETNLYARKQLDTDGTEEKEEASQKKKKSIINPYASLKLLKFPNMFMICAYLGLMGFTNNVMGVSFAWTYSTQYHFSSTLIGIFYLAGLAGNTAGTWLGGYMSDRLYMRRVTTAKENNQQVYPEMRLSQPGVLAAAISMTVAYVAYGWSVEKHAHFSIGITSQVFVLFGLTLGTCFLNVYAVQSFPRHGSSAQACMQTVKCILFAIGRLWAIDLQNLVGIGILYTIFGGILLSTCPFVTYIQIKRKKWQTCRPRIGIDPILLLPTATREHSRVVRWRVGFPPGKPTRCWCARDNPLTTIAYLTACFHLHLELEVPHNSNIDPISYVLNKLPKNPPKELHQQEY